MTKKQLLDMQTRINKWADKIQAVDDFGELESEYNNLWNLLDEAGGAIDSILHGENHND